MSGHSLTVSLTLSVLIQKKRLHQPPALKTTRTQGNTFASYPSIYPSCASPFGGSCILPKCVFLLFFPGSGAERLGFQRESFRTSCRMGLELGAAGRSSLSYSLKSLALVFPNYSKAVAAAGREVRRRWRRRHANDRVAVPGQREHRVRRSRVPEHHRSILGARHEPSTHKRE